MNIFFLAEDPERCAQFHSDRHIGSMCVDYSRILTSEDTKIEIVEWVRRSTEHWRWTRELCYWLNMEYRWRFRRGDNPTAIRTLVLPEPTLPDGGFSVPRAIVPPRYQHSDAIVAYRRYYFARKGRNATYTNRPVPFFMAGWLDENNIAA
jgi:hypothetical protein